MKFYVAHGIGERFSDSSIRDTNYVSKVLAVGFDLELVNETAKAKKPMYGFDIEEVSFASNPTAITTMRS